MEANWPFFSQEEIEAVNKVLFSGKVNYWTGTECRLFEQEFAEYIGTPHAVATANGTLALELALYALNIGPGDDVIVPCRTFLASASCVVARGARPIVADIDLNSQNITVETIKEVITPYTKAIIVVHLAGWPCDMEAILDFARAKNIKIIEDCAQSHGAKYQGRYVGSWGDAAAFSFCQDKIMTTGGEGGIALFNDKNLFEKAWSYKDRGKNYNLSFDKTHTNGFRWLHESFGSNFRLTEMQAAIGRIQLRKLDEWVKHRRKIAQGYHKIFDNDNRFRVTIPSDNAYHAYYKYYVFVNDLIQNTASFRDILIDALNRAGVYCFQGSCFDISCEKAFQQLNYYHQPLPSAEMLQYSSIMLLTDPTINENIIEKTKKVVDNFYDDLSIENKNALSIDSSIIK